MSVFLGLALIVVPVLFNWAFASLAKQFDYPQILRQPTIEVLSKFRAGGSKLVMTWWTFAMSAVLFGIVAVVLPFQFGIEFWLIMLIVTFGLLASVTQFLGLIRWPFMVPHLARESENASAAKLEAIEIVFQSLNRYLGVAVGEHLGYLFTGLWTMTLSFSLSLGTYALHSGWYLAMGVSGCIIGFLLILCSFEFVGKYEPEGWTFAGTITPFVYIGWSLWLIIMGFSILLGVISELL